MKIEMYCLSCGEEFVEDDKKEVKKCPECDSTDVDEIDDIDSTLDEDNDLFLGDEDDLSDY